MHSEGLSSKQGFVCLQRKNATFRLVDITLVLFRKFRNALQNNLKFILHFLTTIFEFVCQTFKESISSWHPFLLENHFACLSDQWFICRQNFVIIYCFLPFSFSGLTEIKMMFQSSEVEFSLSPNHDMVGETF